MQDDDYQDVNSLSRNQMTPQQSIQDKGFCSFFNRQ